MAGCDWCPRKSKVKFPKNFELTPGMREYPNPGTVANLHKKFRDIMPEFYDGIEFSYKKGLATNKILLMKWCMSHTYPSGFRIGGIYSYKCKGDLLETPTIEADINPSTMSSNFSILYYPHHSVRIETRFQRLGKANIYENNLSLEYIRKNSTMALSAYNPTKDSGRVTLSYLRSCTDYLSLGCELLLEWLKAEMVAKTAFAARYAKSNYAVAATVSSEALDVSYWRQLHKSIQMGTSLVFHKRTHKAIGSICYQWEFKDSSVRGLIDSDWSIGCMCNRRLHYIPCMFGLSLIFCVPSNRFAFGLTLDLDPSLKCATD